jgi:hypothetical protein
MKYIFPSRVHFAWVVKQAIEHIVVSEWRAMKRKNGKIAFDKGSSPLDQQLPFLSKVGRQGGDNLMYLHTFFLEEGV